MATLNKALSVLSLFSLEEPRWTVEDAAKRMGIPASTVYRYFRGLSDAGLIVNFEAGRYVIGPGVFALDRLARRTEPLLLAAQKPMDRLAKQTTDEAVVLLSRYYSRNIMCVDRRPHFIQSMQISFERGRPMPLYRGSVGKVILAYHSSRTLARHYSEDHDEIRASGLGTDLKSFRENLRAIKREGFCITKGEVDPGVIGISAPIAAPDGDMFASVTLALPEQLVDLEQLEVYVPGVISTAEAISKALKALGANQQWINTTDSSAALDAEKLLNPTVTGG